jgi:hypothetical protein
MRLSRTWLAVPAVLLALAPAARGGDTDDTAAFLKPSNWEGRSDIWKVENGRIVGETKEDPKYNTFLCSKEKYGDFELSFKVTLRDGVGNSGVQFRSARTDKDGPDNKQPFKVAGPQADMGQQYWGSLYGEGVGGMIKASDAATVKKVVKPKEANDYKLVAKGTKVTITINGETMVDGDFPKLPAKEEKDRKPFPTEGIIAFQAHGGFPAMKVEYSDIKFKKLSK